MLLKKKKKIFIYFETGIIIIEIITYFQLTITKNSTEALTTFLGLRFRQSSKDAWLTKQQGHEHVGQ